MPKQVATLVPLEAGNESGRLCILPGLGQFAGPAGPAGCDFKRKIYISRPPPRGTDRQMYRLSIGRIISISMYIHIKLLTPSLWGREQTD